MNIKEIKEMIALMNDNGLNELEIEKEGMRIKLKKGASSEFTPGTPFIIEKEKLAPAESARLAVEVKPGVKNQEIKAPMVGTFYRAPSPETPPFIDAGQIVEVGQVVCIIEAMKLMNEIKSEIRGKVLEVLAENAEPVEFGQALFLIEAL